MDLEPFKALLSSFSRVNRWNLEILDATGVVFSSGRSKLLASEDVRILSNQIMETAHAQIASLDTGDVLLGVPIRNGQGAVASLIAHRSARPGKSPEKAGFPKKYRHNKMEDLLTDLAKLMEEHWAIRREDQELAEQLSEQYEDLYLYSRISPQIKALRFSPGMLKELIEDMMGTLRVDVAFTMISKRPEYNFIIAQEILSEETDRQVFIDTLLRMTFRETPANEENYHLVSDSRTSPEYRSLHPEPYRFLGVKIRHENNCYGWLGVVSFNMKGIFRRSELRLITSIAEQVAVVMTNVDLYRDLELFAINVVKSLVRAIEAKDVYTRGHSEQVNRYCMRIADQLALEARERNFLHWASLLHDVGKIGIPENILNKRGPLTEKEFAIIKTHAEKGYAILKPLDQLADALPGILHHHEHYDGGGYPSGLKGKDIPFLARIIAVADAFDAVTSERAYRLAKPADQAMALLDEAAGTQFDPDIVTVFKDVYSKYFDFQGADSK